MIKLEKNLLLSGVGKVIMPGPVPQWERGLPNVVVNHLWGTDDLFTFKGLKKKIIIQNNLLKKKFENDKNSSFVDFIDMLCSKDLGCRVSVNGDRKLGLVAWDYGHLTPAGSDYLARKLVNHIFVTD